MRSILNNPHLLLGGAILGATLLGVDALPALRGAAFVLGAVCALAVVVGWRSAADRLLAPLGVLGLSALVLGPVVGWVRVAVAVLFEPTTLLLLGVVGAGAVAALVVRQTAIALPKSPERAPRLVERRRAAVADIFEPASRGRSSAPSSSDPFEVFDREEA